MINAGWYNLWFLRLEGPALCIRRVCKDYDAAHAED